MPKIINVGDTFYEYVPYGEKVGKGLPKLSQRIEVRGMGLFIPSMLTKEFTQRKYAQEGSELNPIIVRSKKEFDLLEKKSERKIKEVM